MSISATLLSGINAGIKTSTLTKYAAASGPTSGTIDTIYDSLDPMQTLIDFMVYDTKPDYLWLGNAASGNIVEVGGSGVDLAPEGTLTYGNTSVPLNTDDAITFIANGDALGNLSGTIALGTSDWTIIHIFDATAWNTGEYVISDRGGDGWSVRQSATTGLEFIVDPTGGVAVPTVTGHAVNTANVIMMRREVGANCGLHTRAGSSEITDPGGSITSDVPNFAICDGQVGAGYEGDWVLTALFPTADITATHRTTLGVALGYE